MLEVFHSKHAKARSLIVCAYPGAKSAGLVTLRASRLKTAED